MTGRPTKVSVAACRRRHGRMIFAMVAVAGLLSAFHAPAADWDGGGLPPAIAKARPSAAVPADLPGSRVDPCAVFGAVSVYQPISRGSFVAVSPSAVLSADGQSCASRPASPVETRAAPPEGGSLPFDDGPLPAE